MYRFVAGLVLCFLIAIPARADLIYSISFDSTGTSLNTNLILAPNASQVVGVFFHESFGAADTPFLDLIGGVNGLTTANFRATRSGPGAVAITAAAGNPLFDLGPTVNFTPTLATVEQEILVSLPVFGTGAVVGPGVRTVQIGTITVTASAAPGDVNTFSLSDFNPAPGANDFIIDNGFGGLAFSADEALNFGTLSINAVPEPSTLALVGFLAIGASGYRFRKRIFKSQSPEMQS
jgi:hypothetical protein